MAKMVAFANAFANAFSRNFLGMRHSVQNQLCQVEQRSLHLVLTIIDDHHGLCVSRFEETIKNARTSRNPELNGAR